MENCSLCLKPKKALIDYIDSTSSEWNQLNVKYVLEKYLWPMDHIGVTSYICTTCWRELYDFHKFYLRIEEAHRNFGLLNQTIKDVKKIKFDIEESSSKQIVDIPLNRLEENAVSEFGNSKDKLADFLNEYDISNSHFQHQVKIEEEEPLIKQNLQEDSLNNSSLVAKRRRGRPRKNSCLGTHVGRKYKKRKCNISNLPSDVANQFEESEANKLHEKNLKTVNERNENHNISSISEHSHFSLENDIDSNIDTDPESLEQCDKKSSIKTNCQQRINHNEKDRFLAENFKITCFLCNIPLETFFAMRKHFEEQHTERGHVKCCNKKFYRRSILVDHVHYHLNPNYFKCSQCGKAMADRRCLELHTETHESTHEKNHFCDICGKGFAKLGVLKKHRMIHLSEEEKRFSCSDCGKNFASNYLLSSHYRSVHQKKYTKICDICGKSIRCKDVFERHMLQHEGKAAPSVSCDICGLLLTDKKALKRHKDIIHPVGGQHEYTCSICSKTSPNLRAHKRHVQYKHIMGYDHKCTICNKAFKRAPTLKEHMASHTGTILYTCPWCPKTFNSNANMHNHRKKVHPKEWEESSRKRYSGNLPPNYKPPTIAEPTNFTMSLDV